MAKFVGYEPCPVCQDKGRDTRGDNLASYSDGGKHCFSCGYHVFPRHYMGEQKQERERINAAVLPTDFSREVPSHALKWLLQYGLPFSHWRPFIGWSEKDCRLVITVGNGPDFSIGRYIPTEGRSCFGSLQHGKTPRKWFVWGECHRFPHIFGDYTNSKQIVLVEDVISAHKLSLVVPTLCLFGTTIFSACIPVLRHIRCPVVLWLDKDQEGTLQKKCQRLQVLTNCNVSYLVTDRDPKEQSFEKIKELLDETV